jgi:hypothetical protein
MQRFELIDDVAGAEPVFDVRTALPHAKDVVVDTMNVGTEANPYDVIGDNDDLLHKR